MTARKSTPDQTDQQASDVDDIPVFAPAEPEPTVAEQIFEIPGWLADNYDELVADPNRNDTYTKLAERSAADPNLAGWARQRAAAAGEDITPVHAAPTPAKTERTADDQ